MTDITRLITSLKRRSSHVKEFGDDITFVKLEDLDVLVEAPEKAQAENTAGVAGMAESYETTISMLRSRIAELENQLKAAENNEIDARCRIAEMEESHAQVIHSRDHYKRISEEGLKQLAESRTVTVKLVDINEFLADVHDKTLALAFRRLAEGVREADIAALTAQGIKWEAE